MLGIPRSSNPPEGLAGSVLHEAPRSEIALRRGRVIGSESMLRELSSVLRDERLVRGWEHESNSTKCLRLKTNGVETRVQMAGLSILNLAESRCVLSL